ncbi:Hypothetical predicted protein [Paramuricea clavata]|uniref:Uncharacterized protein n=1 Tax=Paramuricea clavata TaxID=317549 RepID=A0A7D9HBU6_PARCT|nr:Hypothetical predicted protein [Paramuricea clavata]
MQFKNAEENEKETRTQENRQELKPSIDTAQRTKHPPIKLNRPIPGLAVDLRPARKAGSYEHSGTRRDLLSPTSSTHTHSPDSLSPRSPLSPVSSDHLDNTSR